MGSSWADLPTDLLIQLSKSTTTTIQYLHLRAVCTAWRTALPPNPCHLPPQAPWLMLPTIPPDTRRPDGAHDPFHLLFYDLFQSKTHRFQLPYFSGKYICGSNHGWLALQHDFRISLFNPITGGSINLPSLNVPPTILKVATSKRKRSVPLFQHYTRYVQKMVLSCHPSEPDCLAVAWFLSPTNWELGFCHIRDTRWTILKMWDVGPHLLDFTCINNSVYTINNNKKLLVYDLHNFSVKQFASGPDFLPAHDGLNLVEGDITSNEPLIVRTYDYLGLIKIVVYKWSNDHRHWHEVKNIGKQVLFLNERHCTNMQLEQEQGNGVYYDVRRHSSLDDSFRVGINRVNLETGCDVPHNPCPTEVFPSVSGLPLWFTPSLT